MEREKNSGPKVTLYVRRKSETVAAVPLRADAGHVVLEKTTLELLPGDRIDIAVTYDLRKATS